MYFPNGFSNGPNLSWLATKSTEGTLKEDGASESDGALKEDGANEEGASESEVASESDGELLIEAELGLCTFTGRVDILLLNGAGPAFLSVDVTKFP